jgi:cysteinyl-tRNA synthetase
LHVFIGAANAELDRGGNDRAALDEARAAFALINGVLDVVPDEESVDQALAERVEALLAERRAARARGDFAAADAIRKSLEAEGIAVEDFPGGTRWKKIR